MDADIAALEGELDPAKQKALWADMQRLYADALPALPLFFRAEAHVTPLWLQGYTPTGHADTSSTFAENWHPARSSPSLVAKRRSSSSFIRSKKSRADNAAAG